MENEDPHGSEVSGTYNIENTIIKKKKTNKNMTCTYSDKYFRIF